jgi:hypothetical protein
MPSSRMDLLEVKSGLDPMCCTRTACRPADKNIRLIKITASPGSRSGDESRAFTSLVTAFSMWQVKATFSAQQTENEPCVAMKLSTGDHKTRDQKPDHFLRPGCTETVGRETNPETRTLCVSSGRTLNALTVGTPKLFAMPKKRAQKSLPAIRRRDASGLRRSPTDVDLPLST